MPPVVSLGLLVFVNVSYYLITLCYVSASKYFP